MSKKSSKLITADQFKSLYSRYGFTQAENGSHQVFNEALEDVTTKIIKQAVLQSEHSGHTGLHGEHAKKAIEMTQEIPSGLY